MSHVQGKGTTPSGNQPTTSTRGGASAYPTPANNTGGGSGWGDSGFIKGGIEGSSKRLSSSSGESNSSKLTSLAGEDSLPTERNAAGAEGYKHELEQTGTFMNHKPGGSDTLPGWTKAKGAFNSAMGNE